MKNRLFAALALAIALGATASATALAKHNHAKTDPTGPPPVCKPNVDICDLGG